MKILHVIPGLTHERGGPSACLEALVRHQSAAQHQVTVLTTDQGARRGERLVELAGAVRVESATVRGPDRLAYAPAFAALARRLVRDSDVVHAHSIFTYPIHAALREALAAGVPVVLRPCGQLHRYSLRRSAWRKWIYRAVWGGMVRRAVAAWHYTSADEAADSWPWEPGTHFVAPNGVEPDDYAMDRGEARRAVARRWPEVGDAPYVLFLGRLHPKKRLDLLLQAFRTGAPREFKLVVAGPDECGLWERLSAGLSANGAGTKVVRVGTVGGADKVALLAGARLFALPSEHENFGIAALEALATGTPVLLSPHVDLAAAAVDAGLVHTAPLDVEAWRQRLALLAESPEGGEPARQARQWVRQHYAWDRIAADLVENYRQVLAGRSVAPAGRAAAVR